LAIGTVSFQSIRAALANPVKAYDRNKI